MLNVSRCLLMFFSLLFALQIDCTGQQNIELDPETDFLVPLGSTITIQCTKNILGAAFGWRATLSNGETLFGTAARNNLAPLGVDLMYPSENISVITFNTTNDGIAAVQCRFTNLMDGSVVASYKININSFGPPQTPSNITVTRSSSSLLVTWAVPPVPGVSFTFTVKLSKIIEDSVQLTDLQSYQFDILNGICGPYEVEIVASNLAGSSNASTSGLFPRIIEDICYAVTMVDVDITLEVLFNVSTCILEDNVIFELKLIQNRLNQSSGGSNMSAMCASLTADGQFSCQSRILAVNSYYLFHINGSSTFGILETDPIEISTHGIQGVFLTITTINDTYIVTCTFLTSSDAQGCSYVLTGSGSSNVSGTIIRTSRNSGSVQVFIEDLRNYSMIIAYEIDINNRTINNYPFRSHNILTEDPSLMTCKSISNVKQSESVTEKMDNPTSQAGTKSPGVIIGCSIAAVVLVCLTWNANDLL